MAEYRNLVADYEEVWELFFKATRSILNADLKAYETLLFDLDNGVMLEIWKLIKDGKEYPIIVITSGIIIL